MANAVWQKIQGLVNGFLKFGFTGPMVKKNTGDNDQLDILANNGVSDAKVNVATAKHKTIEVLDVNGLKTTITQPDLAADIVFNLPVTQGNNGESLKTDGAGNTVWAAGENPEDISLFNHVTNFNTSSPDNVHVFAANFRHKEVSIEIVTPFSGGTAPTLSLGVTGSVEKYVEAADIDLGMPSGTKFIFDLEITEGSSGTMIATINPDGSTAGQVRITLAGCIPLTI